MESVLYFSLQKQYAADAKTILDLNESHGIVLTLELCATSKGFCLATGTNTVTKYINGGVNAVTIFKRSINSDNARRKVDKRMKA